MKKKLNFITLLIGIAVAISFYNFIKEESYDMKMGFLAGSEYASSSNFTNPNKRSEFVDEFVNMRFEPKEFSAMPDSIFNRKTGEWLPARIIKAEVYAPVKEYRLFDYIWQIPFFPLALAGVIMVPFNFFLIINSVNKSVIFEWINVKRLRRIGLGFVLYFVADIIARIYENSLRVSFIDMENYNIITSSFDDGVLVYGMIAFLVAEIFAAGLRLKEEQDLTI